MKLVSLFFFVFVTSFMWSQSSPVCFNSLISANVTTVGSMPIRTCTGDFNGDGKSDVAVTNLGSNNISILLGSGTGIFSPAVSYFAGTAPWAICSADFNGDSKADLAVTNVNSSNLSVFMGTGLGTFSPAVTYTSALASYYICSADFNGDASMDLVFSTSASSTGSVSVMLGSSTGTFAAPVSYSLTGNPNAIGVADFNNDGKKDVVVSSNTTLGNLAVLLGTGLGTFSATVNYSVPANPYDLDLADFNMDGFQDICVNSAGTGNMCVLLGSSSGSFAAATSYSTGSQPYGILAGDYNKDGFPDVVVSRSNARSTLVFLGTGTGSFAPSVEYLTIDIPLGMASADFNGDGNLDLIQTNYALAGRVTVILGSASGALQASPQYSVGATPFFLQSADFNGDGKPDLASANWGSNDVSVLLGSGGGQFAAPASYSVGLKPYSLTPSDFNGDGNIDLAVCNYSSNSVSILLGSASGTFGAATNFPAGNTPYSIVSEDFNLDGKKDLAVTNFNSSNVSILIGNGLGAFAAAVSYTSTYPSCYLASADLNGDGNKDLVFTNAGGFVSLLFGSSSGVFSYGTDYAVGTTPYGITIKDFNGDLKQDLAVANFNSNSISVLLGSGAGTFTSTTSFAVGTNPMSIHSDDFNSDGIQDLVVTNYNASNIGILVGTGTGSFLSQAVFTVGANPRGLVSSDFNSDGKKDLALVNMSNNNISILLNAIPTLSLSSASTVCLGNSLSITGYGANTYTWSNGTTGNPGVLTPSASGIYTVFGQSFGGCTATASQSIQVNALPLPTITVNSGSICLGQTFSVNPTGANSYTFTGGGSYIITPNASLSFSVTGSNTLTGCRSQPVVSSVTVYPFPIISASNGNICSGKNFTLTASGAATYIYSGGSPVVSPLTNTSYTITGISAQGCVSSPVTAIVVVLPLPTITVNSGAVCSGKSFTLNPSGAVTYTYSSGGPVVTPLSTTSYSVIGASASGCVSSSQAISIVAVNSLPILTITGNNSVCINSPISLLANGNVLTYTWSAGGNSNLVTLTPSVISVYTVSGTDVNGCIGSATKTVFVNNLPNVIAMASSTSVCSGAQINLSGGGASSYVWSNGVTNGIPFTIPASAVYTVTGTDINGCKNVTSIAIQVNPNPTLTVSGSSAVICAGESANIWVHGANTYSWSTGSLDSILVINPTTTTVYSVTGTNALGCASNTQYVQNVDACLGLSSLKTSAVVQVFPNPFKEECMVEASEEVDIIVVNALGQFIWSQHLILGKNKVNLESYSSGIYFIQLKQDAVIRTIKVIKE